MKREFARYLLWLFLGAPLLCLAWPTAMGRGIRSVDSPIIERFKSTWRAQDGETLEQVISNVSKVAQFVPQMWGVAELGDNDFVFVAWTRHRNNKSDEQYVITWKITPDGTTELASLYAKPMELGWRALALSLIASEVANGERNANFRFLHDPANFNFVTTPRGRLGDLLQQGGCTVVDPVGVDYLPKRSDKLTQKGDLWRVLLLVNCKPPGSRHFTHNDVIAFEKGQGRDWEPQSSFAKRIATFPPDSWFEPTELKGEEKLGGRRPE
ncbi:nodulate formation efficiency C protein [Bradyrhizobium centrosematis]|uniref:nodulate formation efficiency C protein n=1 Tax=Bradyrhizobium centrosematis TaxID=1300039 RepID=UPI003890E441